MLAQHERTLNPQFLDLPVVTSADGPASLVGETIGGYTLERPLGTGGMGTVLDREGQARFRREGTST